MINKEQAISILKKELPGMKPSGKAYVYKNWYVIEMIGENQNPNNLYLDSFYKVNRNNGQISAYSSMIDTDIDVYKVKEI